MKEEIVELQEDVSSSPLYSEDLAPVPKSKRTWGTWDLAAIWVGMAVCIPTYLLASYMIKSGLTWSEAIIIIMLGNLIITIPMVLNGHAGVKYGLPFPVIGRAAFGTKGIHIASLVRGIVASGWFGIQTWVGGLAFYGIYNAITGQEGSAALDAPKFISFALFWLVNVFFIWKGIDSIKWLEKFAAPILVFIGVALIFWGSTEAGGFKTVLYQSNQLSRPTAVISEHERGLLMMRIQPLTGKDGFFKASQYQLTIPLTSGKVYTTDWYQISPELDEVRLDALHRAINKEGIIDGTLSIGLKVRSLAERGHPIVSNEVQIFKKTPSVKDFWTKIWSYLLWLTAMVGFWATMAISIADITRYTKTQRNQVLGQFIGLPGTMVLFSFVGIFVTLAALINFQDVLIAEDAPWDPVSLLNHFENPVVIIIAQIFMLVATLSTNIAANVIAPANAFANLMPKKLTFQRGGLITAIIGVVICPWWLMDEISELLLLVSSFLGPVLGIMISDYYLVNKKQLDLAALFKEKGKYSFGGSGFNASAMVALLLGIVIALIGLFVPALSFLYNLSWFSGFFVSFFAYYLLMKRIKDQ